MKCCQCLGSRALPFTPESGTNWHAGRHICATVTGTALLYYAYGNQLFILLVLSALIYILLIVCPSRAGLLSWLICMPYLIFWCA